MNAVWINFVQPWPLRVRVLRYALLACGLLLLGLALLQQNQLKREKTAISWQLQNLQRSAAGQTLTQRTIEPATEQATEEAGKRAMYILQQLDRPWNTLFNTLESAIANDIVILLVAPNAQQEALTLKAMATDSEAAIDFADRLRASHLLSDIHMVQEEPWEENERFPLQFSISASWSSGVTANRNADAGAFDSSVGSASGTAVNMTGSTVGSRAP